MTTPTLTDERADELADVRALVMARVLPRWRERYATPDLLSPEAARAFALELLAETVTVTADLEALADELAKFAAQAGASHDERGAAVGTSRETARRRWPWKAARG